MRPSANFTHPKIIQISEEAEWNEKENHMLAIRQISFFFITWTDWPIHKNKHQAALSKFDRK